MDDVMNFSKVLGSCFCWVFLSAVSLPVSSAEYDNKKQFTNIAVISSTELKARLDNILLIDVRSPYEYQVVHINC